MKTITQLSDEVAHVQIGERLFCLIGTAHVSKQSADLVEETLRSFNPEEVCIELDAQRLESLQNPNRWRETDLFKVIKSGRTYTLLAQLVLASFQKRIADHLGVKPGEEMLRAYRAGSSLGVPVRCVDREIRTTMKRAWARTSLREASKMFISALGATMDRKKVEAEEIERLKRTDALSAIMEEFSGLFPRVKGVLIDERDRFMAAALGASKYNRIAAVVGAGHMQGICRSLGEDIDVAALTEIPAPGIKRKLLGWLIPGLVILLIAITFFRSGADVSISMLGAWILITGSLSAAGALIALAHPLTIAASFAAAPLTTLHPLLAAGWFSGIVEVCVRKPRVSDMETIIDDVGTVSGWWRNRVSRILLVVMLANLGSALGAILGAGFLISRM